MSAGSPTTKRFILGIAGASGAIYADRFLTAFAATPHQLDIVASKIGAEIFRQERGRQFAAAVEEWVARGARMRMWEPNDFYAPFSSGSQLYDGMAVVPCSAGALGRIAAGTSDDLLSRAADVCLKEARPLVLMIREAPYSEIHLQNMLTLRRAGATILPASPGFYTHPKNLDEMADSLVQRVFDHLHIDSQIFRRWRERAGTMAEREDRPLDRSEESA